MSSSQELVRQSNQAVQAGTVKALPYPGSGP
jgi:hypothetical protein